MIKIYNLTLHNQQVLHDLVANCYDIEVKPRLKPVDPMNFGEIKQAVCDAIRDLKLGDYILIGGLTQFATLLAELGMFKIVYADYDFSAKEMRGLIFHETWSRQERFQIEKED